MTNGNVASYWWAIIIRGLIGLLFGIAAFAWTGVTLGVLVFWLGTYMLIGGIFSVTAGIKAAAHHHKWMLLVLEGLVGIAAGIFTYIWPLATVQAFLWFIAAWAVLSGMLQISGASSGPWESGSKWLIGISGGLSIIMGMILFTFSNNFVEAFAVVWVLGLYAILFGVAFILAGIRLCGAK